MHEICATRNAKSGCTTRDRNRSVAAFAGRGRSAFYRIGRRPTSARVGVRRFDPLPSAFPSATQAWLARLREREPRRSVEYTTNRVPSQRMSDTCKRFTTDLLVTPTNVGCWNRSFAMNALFVAWSPTKPERADWRPVGRLVHDGQLYRFCYTYGARKPGFRPFQGMENLDHDLRLGRHFFRCLPIACYPSRGRSTRRTCGGADLTSPSPPDPIVMLGITEGIRQTDAVEVFPCPVPDAVGCYINRFFLHGIQWLPINRR